MYITRNRKRLIGIFAGVMAMALSIPAVAGDGYDKQKSKQDQQWNKRNQQSSSQQMRDQQGTNWRLDQEGFVQIAYDYDQDNKIDAVETIATYDLDKARRSSQQRRQQMQRQQQGEQWNQRSQQSRQNQQGQLQLDPQGWIKVAYDYDRDNKIDAVETIYAYDLQRALQSSDRRQSQQRAQRYNQQSQRDRQMAQRQRSQLQRNLQGARMDSTDRIRTRAQQKTFSGQVTAKDTFRLAGMTEPHVFAKVRTQQGRTHRVDLGKRTQVDRLNIDKGDRITVQGQAGRVNGKSVVVADRVQSGNRNVRIDRREDQANRLMRLTGRISDTRTVQFTNRQDPSLVAMLNRDDGKTVSVILGPKDDLDELNLGAGDRITALARQVTLNNRQAFAATQFTTEDKFVQVERPEQRERFLAQQFLYNQR